MKTKVFKGLIEFFAIKFKKVGFVSSKQNNKLKNRNTERDTWLESTSNTYRL